jgi:acetyl-CoA synthetase
MKWGDEFPDKHDLSSIRVLGTVGEPINPEAWLWYRRRVGGDRVPVVDTWWQTETGAIMISPLPGVSNLKPGSASRPVPGVSARVVEESGKRVERGGGGYLVLDEPWPSMLRDIYKDHERFGRPTGPASPTRAGALRAIPSRSISSATAARPTKTATSGCGDGWTTS